MIENDWLIVNILIILNPMVTEIKLWKKNENSNLRVS